MSIIQNIREKGAWIIFGIIAIALIAFILQDGIGRNKGSNDLSVLGKVNGEVINKTEFDEKLNTQLQQYAGQGVKREQMIGYLWEQEVTRLLFKTESEKLGISVGTKELTDVLFGNESPFKREFTDQSTGEFKVNDAKNALAQIKKSKNKDQIKQIEQFYIEPAIENRIRNKYQALVVKGVQVPKWLIEKQFADLNTISSINFVQVPYNTISDSTIKVSNEEIESYLKENEAAYQVEETSRKIGYVGFSASPTASDSLNTINEINGLKEGFKNATDAGTYLNKVGSEIPYYNSYISKKTLQIPQKDSVLNVGIGNIYGPYVDGKNYTIAKVLGVKQWSDSTSARHILIATTNPQTGQQIKDDSSAKKLIDSIASAIKGGASFDALCLKYSDDGGSKARGGNLGMFAQAQMVPAFNDFCFDNSVGTKGVVKTEIGYHFVEILKQTTRGPAYKIAYLSKAIIPSNETINAASTAAAQFASTSKDVKSFNENAVKLGKQVLPAAGIKVNDFEIQGLGETRQLVRWVYEKKVNDVSEPIELGDTYIVAVITNEDKAGLASAETAKPQVEGIIRDQKKAEKIKQTLKGNNIDAIASSAKTIVQRADSLSFTYSMVPGLGNEPKLVGAAFNKSLVNKVSAPIAGNAGVFVLSVNNVGAKPSQQDIAFFKEENLNRTRSAMFRSNKALKKIAKIEDNRSKIF
jgi:peptidyl-prolyl cis-trans isomerase D